MECPRCQAENREGQSFCGGCGHALAGAATVARRPVPERRQLTAMFCDMVGSTALSQQLDPEDLREVIQTYQETAHRVIARYEGYVARYMGDGLLVYFGYPQAHEDAAARAVHAGLEIVEALGQLELLPAARGAGHPRVRIGIATGLVVVGDLIGEGASRETAAVGETLNLASRLQTLAEPDEVVVAERTRELAGARFVYADHGLHALKGFDAPLPAWRVLRPSAVQNRFDAARSRQMTPFVGRRPEIDFLLGQWRRACAGQGQVVLLSGEAGIGKSRIAETLAERVAAAPHHRLRCQCSPYHANTALHPLIQQLERTAGFTRDDTAAQRLDKLEALLARSSPPDAESAALLAALLSLPTGTRYPPLQLTPQQQKQKTLLALLEHVREIATRAPLFLLLEDAHWVDPTSTELLGLLAEEVQRLPVLLLVTSRRAAGYPWLGLPHVASLALERLDRWQSANMVERLLEGHKLPAEVTARIVAKTDGVPLFIEEVTKALVTSDALRAGDTSPQALLTEIPSTLQDSLMARLDRLGAAKEVAQVGAVIGREFSRALVAALSPAGESDLDHALGRLTDSGLVFGRGPAPATVFVFKHALVQDAAYASLLRSKRQELHRRIAQALAGAEPEVLAHHHAQAGQAVPAARFSAAAALRALDRSANVEAVGHAGKGLELLAGVAQSAERNAIELGLWILQGAAYRAVKGFASSDVERSFTRALELGEKLGSSPQLLDVRRGLFSCYYARGALAAAQEQGQHVAALGQRLGDRSSQMLGLWMLGCMASWQGHFVQARHELEQAVALYDPGEQKAKTLASQIDPGVNALCHLSWVLWVLGFPHQALKTSDAAVRNARALAQPFALAMTLFFACETRACCGEHASAGPLLDELLALTTEHGLGYLGSCARMLKGQALIARDDCVAGLEQVDLALAEFEAQEGGLGFPWCMAIAAAGHARLGRTEEGLQAVAAGFQAMARNGERHWEAELWRLKGELLLSAPQATQSAQGDDGENCLRRAIDVAQHQGARSLELRATTGLAQLLARRHERATARTVLAAALGTFTEGAGTADLLDATSLLQRLCSPSRE